MEVYNLHNKNTGKPVVNQIVIVDDNRLIFQSYKTTIAIIKNKTNIALNNKIVHFRGLDGKKRSKEAYQASKTTLKYLCQFLNIKNKKELDNKIKIGEYKLINGL